MMLLTRKRLVGVDLVLILEDNDLQQIGSYQPISAKWRDLPAEASRDHPHRITIAYATAEELKQIELMRLADAVNWQLDALKLLSRGKEGVES